MSTVESARAKIVPVEDRGKPSRRVRNLLLLLWLCFLLRGWFYCNFTPLWEGYDEPFHFAFLQFVVQHHGELPLLHQAHISREVRQSLQLAPVPWLLRDTLRIPVNTEEAYWRLPAAERLRLQAELRSLPREWAREADNQLGNYEAQQAPLYYWLISPLLAATRKEPLAERVMWLRYLNLLLASLLVPLGFAAARRVFHNHWPALAAVAALTAMPELFVNFCRVANEALAAVLYTLFLLVLLNISEEPQRRRAFYWAGLVLGLGLLTKAYFLAALPALLAVAAWCGWKRRATAGRLALHAAMALVIAGAIAGWWYGRNLRVSGSLSGVQYAAKVGHTPSGVLAQVLHVNWKSGLVSIVLSHIWFGDWSFLRVPNWMYLAFGVVIFAGVAGNLLLAVRWLGRRGMGIDHNHLLVLWSVYGFFWAGLGYDVLMTYAAVGVSASTGWYMYCVGVPEIILLLVGLGALLGKVRLPWIAAVLTACLAALDLYTVDFLSIPYYTGLIAHDAAGRVVAAGWGGLKAAGWHMLLSRLQANKPEFLGGGMLGFSWIVFLLATVAVVGMGCYCAAASEGTADRGELG